MKRIVASLVLVLIPSLLLAAQFSTVCHNELSAWLKADKKLSIVDIQDAEEFRAHNFDQSISTANDPARLKKTAARLRKGKEKVIVVSPTGGADALLAAQKLELGGVRHGRILVLEGGMEAAVKNAACDCCVPAALQGEAK